MVTITTKDKTIILTEEEWESMQIMLGSILRRFETMKNSNAYQHYRTVVEKINDEAKPAKTAGSRGRRRAQ